MKFFPCNVELLPFSPNDYFEILREENVLISQILKKKLKPKYLLDLKSYILMY